MKVAIYSKDFPLLSQTFVDRQINSFVDLDIDVSVLTSNETGSSKLLKRAINVIDIGGGGDNKKSKLFFGILILFKMFVSNFKIFPIDVLYDEKLTILQKVSIFYLLDKKVEFEFDLVIAHFGNSGYFLHKLRLLGIIKSKIAVVFHGYEISRYKEIKKNIKAYKSIFSSLDFFFPISDFWKARLVEWGCPTFKIHTIRMGVDIEKYTFKTSIPSLSTKETIKVVQVGRLTEKKGILDTIRAIAFIRSKFEITLDVIGDGELMTKAKDLTLELGCLDNVNFHGALPNDKVWDMLYESDIYILPSKTASDGDMEGIPVALMEAMSIGIPVISTYHSGIPELIENGDNGFLVDEGDVSQIVNKLNHLKGLDSKELDILRNKARLKIEKSFNTIDQANKIIKIISGV